VHDEDTAKRIIESRRVKLVGRVGWSRGLTKEGSDALRRAAATRSETVSAQFASGERSQWNKGLTHETSKSVADQRQRLIEGYEDGSYSPWAKGLTKESDERVLMMSQSVARTMRSRDVRDRLDALKRLSHEEVLNRLSAAEGSLVLISDPDEYVRDRTKNLKFKCVQCDSIQIKSLIEASSGRCSTCSPAGSRAQIEVDRFIRSMGETTYVCDRSVIGPYELDIHVPPKKIAIEYNGLYFHSALFKGKNYHSNKTRLCAEVGVNLIHIFEDEWRDKRDICESMIAHRLGLSRSTMGARQCKTVVIDPQKRKKFFNETHIDGDVKASACFGLINELGDLVACMSLRRPLHKKFSNRLEIARYSTRCDTNIVGGLSKLTAAAKDYARSLGFVGLLTYVDTRWGTGKGYLSAGWDLISQTPNRFWWTDGRVRIDRFKIRADRQQGLTEQQVADQHGVVKIWGCPNLVLTVDV